MSVKVVHKTLMKLTPGVNFTNVLCTASTCADPINEKKYSKVVRSQKRRKTNGLAAFFALLGSACVKTACKMFVKLAPEKYRQNKQFSICQLERVHLCHNYEDSISKYWMDPIPVLRSPNKRDNNNRMIVIIKISKCDRHQRRFIL